MEVSHLYTPIPGQSVMYRPGSEQQVTPSFLKLCPGKMKARKTEPMDETLKKKSAAFENEGLHGWQMFLIGPS